MFTDLRPEVFDFIIKSLDSLNSTLHLSLGLYPLDITAFFLIVSSLVISLAVFSFIIKFAKLGASVLSKLL